MLARFLESSEKRHSATDIALRDQQATLCNQQAYIMNIEMQVGQLSGLLQERLSGLLPSNTKITPKAHVLAIATDKEGKYVPLVLLESNKKHSDKYLKEQKKIKNRFCSTATTRPHCHVVGPARNF